MNPIPAMKMLSTDAIHKKIRCPDVNPKYQRANENFFEPVFGIVSAFGVATGTDDPMSMARPHLAQNLAVLWIDSPQLSQNITIPLPFSFFTDMWRRYSQVRPNT